MKVLRNPDGTVRRDAKGHEMLGSLVLSGRAFPITFRILDKDAYFAGEEIYVTRSKARAAGNGKLESTREQALRMLTEKVRKAIEVEQ